MRIKVGVLMQRLNDHVLGKLEMSQSQIKAAEILLRKAIPDLRSVEHSGEIVQRHVNELSDAELAHLATRGSEGTAETPAIAPDTSGIH
jgi:hypothetical protein